ncbi:MAG: putative holliday junction resolvase [Puniceicoccaceae bacterium 5H]|nr:MAG: putative holliday junction resolvase [Puniceicoccaceae bacterium 5H]
MPRYLGIDYGEKRIGLAYGDELGVATPLPAVIEPNWETRAKVLGQQIAQRRIDALVVGYPYNMDGSVGFKAREVDAFIARLEEQFGLPVHRIDERLTSHQVETQLRAMGRKNSNDRKTRATGEIDSRAASLILQDYLDLHHPALMPEPWDED